VAADRRPPNKFALELLRLAYKLDEELERAAANRRAAGILCDSPIQRECQNDVDTDATAFKRRDSRFAILRALGISYIRTHTINELDAKLLFRFRWLCVMHMHIFIAIARPSLKRWCAAGA
jgi:hypothetical protein